MKCNDWNIIKINNWRSCSGPCRANAEILSEVMDSQCWLMLEILATFMGQPTSAKLEKEVRYLFKYKKSEGEVLCI